MNRGTCPSTTYRLGRVYAWLADQHEPVTVRQVADAVGTAYGTAHRDLRWLEARGHAEQIDARGPWVATDDPPRFDAAQPGRGAAHEEV